MRRSGFFVAAVILSCFLATSAHGQEIVFDEDSDADIILVSNTNDYEVGFRKSNGSIAFIKG